MGAIPRDSPTSPHSRTIAAREALLRALKLLDDRDDPQALNRAREAAQLAAEAVPYRWEAPHCSERRHTYQRDTCARPTCTRCAAFEAGGPTPLTGW
ncbi:MULTISPECIES: hypothetical protein [unclassified Streptomyces]|uniref:hypothetical protein n=1 Tax=unclassified Streptomyces TaxID=2593676 RepID=UPI0022557B99|nr:hypothetical protein [Streptomyces sp. NBC_00063]MCX5442882.1 hypothetical protein [Streptomyces sp. NBC_00063]